MSIVLPLPLPGDFACSLPSRYTRRIGVNYHIMIPFKQGGFCATVILGIRCYTPARCRIGSVSTLLSTSPVLLPIRFGF